MPVCRAQEAFDAVTKKPNGYVAYSRERVEVMIAWRPKNAFQNSSFGRDEGAAERETASWTFARRS
jgi:hypothetical protein